MALNIHWLWFAVMIVCLLIEAGTFGLTTIWFAIGALVTIFLSFTGLSLQFQILFFLLISLVLLIVTRPFAVKKLHIKKVRTNADALIGGTAAVTKKITPLERGEIKINGTFWSAKPADSSVTFEPGALCVIVAVEGVTAVVTSEK